MKLLICPSCGLLVTSLMNNKNCVLKCSRCNSVLLKYRKSSLRNCFVFSLSALILFFPTITYPMLKISMKGVYTYSSIWSCIQTFYTEGFVLLSLLVLCTVVIFPFLYFISISYVVFSFLIAKKLPFTRQLLKLGFLLSEWSMIDVLLIGILVSSVKLIGMFGSDFGSGFYLVATLTILGALIEYYFDKNYFWFLWGKNERL